MACAIFSGVLVSSAADSAVPVITIDAQDKGRVFDGIGALSAGASSRLLIDYPEPQRSEILDFLFKPKFGASLQINKVEIGGDMNSTDGSEPSHMRTEDDENYHRGYEWWLMVESKKRNPAVKLHGLAWGAPNWINPKPEDPEKANVWAAPNWTNPKVPNPNEGTVWSKQFNTYLINWVRGAKSVHNLDIDGLGGWNERGFDVEWYKQFRKALNNADLSKVQVVCDDGLGWEVGDAMKKDPEFAASFDVVGMHYSLDNVPNPQRWQVCYDSGKPLWDSETGSAPYNSKGAKKLVKTFNRCYINNRLTGFINWATIWSVFPGLICHGHGLMLANEPWSGYYKVGVSIWAVAHTTQFTQPGWQYLDSACAYIEGSPSNGSFVALRSPDKHDFTLVAETVDATKPSSVTFALKGDFATVPLHVVRTDLNSRFEKDWFVNQRDILTEDGRFTITFDPGCVYTVSTIAGHKGVTTPPPSAILPLPYKEDFQSYEIGSTPKYISDQHGTFEVAQAGGGRTGKCLRQMVTAKPVFWNTDAEPGTITGSTRWRDYTVSADALLEQPGYVELVGRIGMMWNSNTMPGYHLRLDDLGRWSLRVVYEYPAHQSPPKEKELSAGVLPKAVGTGKWHKLSMSFLGDQITASIDGQVLGEPIKDATHPLGLVGLVTGRWNTSQFMNLEVIPNGDKAYDQVGQLLQGKAKVIRCDSQSQDDPADNAIDGDPETVWHTLWEPKPAPFPHFLVVDLNTSRKLRGIRVLPRVNGPEGRMADCTVYVSEKPDQWGDPVAITVLADTPMSQEILFPAPVSGRYLKLESRSSHRNNPNTVIADLDIVE